MIRRPSRPTLFPTRRSSDLDLVKPGLPTEAIDKFVFDFAMDHGARPATLMYRGYNRSTCTSINHVVCHGRSEEHTSELQSLRHLVCRLLLEKKNKNNTTITT